AMTAWSAKLDSCAKSVSVKGLGSAKVNLTPFQDRLAGSRVRVGRTLGEQCLHVFGRGAGRTDIAKHVAIEQPYIDVGRFEATSGCLGDNVECSFGLRRRTGNGAQDVGASGLIFKRFPQLVEQARVLDRDDGLRGEIAHKVYLLVGERPNLLTEDTERANELVSLEHRHTNCCALAGEFDGCHAIRVPLKIGAVAANIGSVSCLLRARDSTQQRGWSRNVLF